MQTLNFNDFDTPYIFVSTKYYCNRGYTYFENSDTSFELSRYVLINKNAGGDNYFDYTFKVLTPDNVEGGQDTNFRLVNVPDKKLLLTVEQGIVSEESVVADIDNNDNYLNVVITSCGAFLIGELKKITEKIYTVNFMYYNNEPITEENSYSCESRMVLSNENVEPAFDSDGYILPQNSLTPVI